MRGRTGVSPVMKISKTKDEDIIQLNGAKWSIVLSFLTLRCWCADFCWRWYWFDSIKNFSIEFYLPTCSVYISVWTGK